MASLALAGPLRAATAASDYLAALEIVNRCCGCEAPALPLTGTRIVRAATEPELQAAIDDLREGDTVLLSDGIYPLTRSLYVRGRNNVTIRGASGCTNVVLRGKGMDNPNHGEVPFGIWSDSANTTIAHLTIEDTYDNSIILNPGAQAPHLYSVKLLDAGSQFLKANPTAPGEGVNDGKVEYCSFEYSQGPPATDHGAGVGYFNGISAHASRNWTIRHCIFRNLHNPDSAAYPWNPAVLMWRRSSGTVTEQNVFINVDRAIAYGLENGEVADHTGGVIRNNFVYLAPHFLTAARRASSDAAILAWNSPGTAIDHNTLLLNSNVAYAVEFRFARTTGGFARNNLADAPVHLRDSATATLGVNLESARADLFVDPAVGDLHLLPLATNIIDQAFLTVVVDDIDGDLRPQGIGADFGADEMVKPVLPIITRVSVRRGILTVSFISAPGRVYSLERAATLPVSTWVPAIDGLVGTGRVLAASDSNAVGAARSFYRVRETGK